MPSYRSHFDRKWKKRDSAKEEAESRFKIYILFKLESIKGRILEINLTVDNEKPEKFKMAQYLDTIASAVLIPLLKPEKRNNFILGEPILR